MFVFLSWPWFIAVAVAVFLWGLLVAVVKLAVRLTVLVVRLFARSAFFGVNPVVCQAFSFDLR